MEGISINYFKALLTFFRKYYLLVIFFSLAINSMHFIIAMPPFTILFPLLYLFLSTKILSFYRQSQGVELEGFNNVLSSSREKVRDTLLMVSIYLIAFIPALVTFLFIRDYGSPLQLYTFSAHQSQASINEAVFINNILVSAIPFLIVISLFSFVPFVIFDSSEDASYAFILKRSIKITLKWYFLILLVRLLASIRYITVIIFALFPFAALVAVFDRESGGQEGAMLVRGMLFLLLFVILVVIPLYHTLMITMYEKARKRTVKLEPTS